jgi:hypothetical protein
VDRECRAWNSVAVSFASFQLSTADVARTRAKVLALGRPGGTQTYTAQKRVGRSELNRFLEIMLDGVSKHHFKYSQKTTRPPNTAMYKQTQIATP